MPYVRGFSILFCLLFFFEAHAFDSAYSNVFVRMECQRFLANNCEKMPEGVRRSLEACSISQKAHNCEKVAKDHPEIKDLIISCNAKEFCEQQTYSATDEALSCLSGVKESVVDTVQAITGLVTGAWEKIKTDHAKRAAFSAACDKSIACKRDLTKDSVYHNKLSDTELDKYSTAQLVAMNERAEIAKRYGYNYGADRPQNTPSIASRRDPNYNISSSAMNSESTAKKLRDLWNTASELASEKYHRYSCYTPEAKEELKCYIFASIVDPTLVVGKGAKLLKARRLIAATEKEVVVAARAMTSREFTQKYLQYSPTTKEQNLKWIALADGTPKNTKFFDVENSVMKNLNDTLKDKNLVTSLTNFHKDILQTKTEKLFAELKKQYPDLELVAYSDFKASRFAFKGQGPPDLEARLAQILKETNQEFSDYVTKSKIVKASDHPEDWFRAGFGDTADQATLASRFSRQSSENSLQSYSSNEMKSTLTVKVHEVESLRTQLQSELGKTSLLEGAGTKKTLSSDAIDILRKNGDDLAKSQADLKNRFGLSEISTGSIQKMQSYVKSVDEFSPGIHIAQRELSHLDDAAFGGLSADMTGMGAKNLNATAKALSESKSLDEALVQTRKSEKEITAQFNKQKDTFQDVVKDVLGKDRVKTVCSGDDCTAVPKQALSDREKEKILQKLTDAGYSSEFRLAFIPEKVVDTAARSQLAVHGESIEKALRKNLADKMEPAKLKGLVFGVDMKTTTLNEGGVKLMTASSSQVKLTASEQKLISESFKKAVEQINPKYHVWNP